MTKRLLIIGIGAGDPNHMTVQAIEALNRADAILLMDKGPAKRKLIAVREEICRRFLNDRPRRFVEADSPERDKGAADYERAVGDLNAAKQDAFERLIGEELKDGETGAVMVWGDPSLYDSTVRTVAKIADGGRHHFEWEVIPGVTSLQALAARFRTTLNRVGGAVAVTTGRRIAKGFPDGVDDAAVMLDAENAWRAFAGDPDVEIFWGAYVGMAEEILISGRLEEVAPEIERRRAEARAREGWIMDSYILRRRPQE